MKTDFDLVVVGAGIMGAATAWRTAAQGASVVVLEKGGPTHTNGSSHGVTRIFRQAYWEGEKYLPLLGLADQGWRELEAQAGTKLRVPTGGVFIGPRSTGVIAGSLRTARNGGIAHAHLTADIVRRRFPQFKIDDDMEAVHEPGAYAVLAEEARLHMLNLAVSQGAQLRYGDAVTDFEGHDAGVKVQTQSGSAVTARSAVVCAGAWAGTLMPELAAWLRPRRVPIFWFAPRDKLAQRAFEVDAFPVFLYDTADGKLLYGFPSGCSTDQGVKIGFHNHQQVTVDPDMPAPDITPYAQEICRYVERIFPDLDPNPIAGKWCFYTMTTDEAFLLDQSRQLPRVFYASACSGHGFKFAPAIGQVLSELVRGVRPSVNIDVFSARRWTAAG